MMIGWDYDWLIEWNCKFECCHFDGCGKERSEFDEVIRKLTPQLAALRNMKGYFI